MRDSFSWCQKQNTDRYTQIPILPVTSLASHYVERHKFLWTCQLHATAGVHMVVGIADDHLGLDLSPSNICVSVDRLRLDSREAHPRNLWDIAGILVNLVHLNEVFQPDCDRNAELFCVDRSHVDLVPAGFLALADNPCLSQSLVTPLLSAEVILIIRRELGFWGALRPAKTRCSELSRCRRKPRRKSRGRHQERFWSWAFRQPCCFALRHTSRFCALRRTSPRIRARSRCFLARAVQAATCPSERVFHWRVMKEKFARRSDCFWLFTCKCWARPLRTVPPLIFLAVHPRQSCEIRWIR